MDSSKRRQTFRIDDFDGAVAPRGERGTLIVSLDALLRMSSNPFFPYMIERIEEGILSSAAETPINATTPP